MKRFILPFLLLFVYTNIFPQVGTGPVSNCLFPIPEICPGGSYPASTSGTATAPGASFVCPGGSPITLNGAFFYFEVGTAGDIDLVMDPVDPFTGALLPPPQDLDFICWGPFNSTAVMCTQLQAVNRVDCSFSTATSETCNITGANVGDIYVIEVSNWASSGTTPNACNIQFYADTTNGGIENPFVSGGFAGANATIYPCSSDPIFNLTDQLNGFPDSWGTWIDASNNPIGDTFDPANDPGGIYRYVMPGSINCPSDTAWLTINLISASSISITSSATACSDDAPFTLTATPSGGTFSINGVTGNTFTPDISLLGSNTIEYIYQANGCSDTTLQNLIVNESPTVNASNVVINNPLCFGESTGSALITATGGTPSSGAPFYTYFWYGADPFALPAGTFNYTVTDAVGCSFSSDVTLYDPLNNLGVLNAYSSSCFGANDGSVGIVLSSGTTPPGTVSLLNYCQSSPNTVDFIDPVTGPNQDVIIEEVILNGDVNNINNNTSGSLDYYEDYTSTMFADITEGQSYTIDITLGDLSGFNIYTAGAKVFIDFNIDGDFDDAGEDVGTVSAPAIIGISTPINFTVPTTLAYGPTRMRVVAQDNLGSIVNANDIGPCDYADPSVTNAFPWFGATEDYSIVLNAPTVTADFLWDNGSTTLNSNSDSITGLSPGQYIVTITPSNGCAVQDTAVVLEPNQITFNPSITPISCNTFTDGIISLNPAGGTNGNGPYSEDWGSNNPLAVGDGSYLVTVTDLSTITVTNPVGCQNDTTINITEPPYFGVDFSVSSNQICLNEPVSLDFNFNQNGIAPFTINYTENGTPKSAGPINSNGIHNISIVPPNIGNNNYTITSIIDNNGCINQNNNSVEIITVNALPDIDIVAAPNPICVNDNAILSFSTPSGSPPFVVNYLAGGINSFENITGAGTNIQVNPITTTTYKLTFVTDGNGCTSNLSDSATLVVNEIPQLTFTSPSETCDGDLIQLKFDFSAGAAPWILDYSTNGVSTVIPINNSIDSIAISPSTQTIYTINSITDNNNCINNISQTITINTNSLPEIVLSGGDSICADGSTAEVIFTTSSGTPPYNLDYSAGLITNSASNIGTIYILSTNQAGIYTIQDLTDSKGCKAKSITGNAYVHVNPLPDAEISFYPQPADITNPLIHFFDASTGHISGEWNFGDGETTNSNLGELTHIYRDTGTYQVTLEIESDFGCTDISEEIVTISPVFDIYIPTAFTPNNDLSNDYFLPIVDGVQQYEFTVYNRLGQRIYVTNEYRNDYMQCMQDKDWEAAWDGKINNEYATKGIYIYSIKLTDLKGKLRTYEGAITLIR
tara:strand:+ start:2813 stop:6766 length:3954 start_codon:yes stop_codon:yes gene_type:complete